MPMIDSISRKTMATHVSRLYLRLKEKVKNELLAKQEVISFTQDAWTAPNMNAFMAVTAHFINEKFQLQDLTLAIPNVRGLLSFYSLYNIDYL